MLEVLVRTGSLSNPTRPLKSEKGLQDISSRDGHFRPVRLHPLLRRDDLSRFEPQLQSDVPKTDVSTDFHKNWIVGISALGKGTIAISEEVVQTRETKRIDWKDLRNLVLFRFYCGISHLDCVMVVSGDTIGVEEVPSSSATDCDSLSVKSDENGAFREMDVDEVDVVPH